jgi:bifunctional non-homologous end joining protein LigD
MATKLGEYQEKRDADRTPEPFPDGAETGSDDGDTFVIQEHHARRLHWDVRLERDGVLVSWAVPMGLPNDPETTHLAVHTEDHPLAYRTFEGTIPAGEYGAGRMSIWDCGRYETLHWNDHKVDVVLRGERANGRYELVNQHDEDEPRKWMIRRKHAAADGWERLPSFLKPMLAECGKIPPTAPKGRWAYEFDWSGLRTSARIRGGRVVLLDADGNDVTDSFPELRGLGEGFGSTEAYLDGEIIVLDQGKTSSDALARRRQVTTVSAAKRLVRQLPAVYLAYDILHYDGEVRWDLPYLDRRALLADLGLSDEHWQTPEHYLDDGEAVLEASEAHGLAGVVAKRTTSPYRSGERSRDWRLIPTTTRTCETVSR